MRIRKIRNMSPTIKMKRFSMEPEDAIERALNAIDDASAKLISAKYYLNYAKPKIGTEECNEIIEDLSEIIESINYLYGEIEKGG